ncbi:MAG: hypothetical protein COV57_00740 [Candidatus Liptonbacteria bacterium CG11_big_fil_rev_8_21_14_0_20_35_14]|uniref:Metallo-beta-lactamase domain-containing protein n=1 Tax=Candidatus Liptonbacteria bacterium CG11_big_fil_rev_8_21_14_0_20_35_14 TaxID=1974634 RepID=A0A2H0N8D3_9BACT|nr:MAG: hypothetical protein COV57_00740 [Candidatus Liptonbacteria bacterium CG11_big_fil_rev_8_21_14_0_20_35_14]
MKKIIIVLFCLGFLNIYLWSLIIFSNIDLAVYFLDIGQGDAIVLQLPGQRPAFVMIDTGFDKSASALLNKVLIGNRIDILVLTHEDRDHSGGAPFILKNYKVSALVNNGLQNIKETWKMVLESLEDRPQIALREGDKILYGDSTITVLNPGKEVYGVNNNANSLVMLLESLGVSFLFTGDIDDKVEKKLLDSGLLKDVDVLKVPHHGSKYGSTNEFLKIVNPEISIITVGQNYFGHPRDETLKRLANIKSLIFRTDEAGGIKIYLKDDKLIVSSL